MFWSAWEILVFHQGFPNQFLFCQLQRLTLHSYHSETIHLLTSLFLLFGFSIMSDMCVLSTEPLARSLGPRLSMCYSVPTGKYIS